RSIDDPEMPISIVDLGIVKDVRMERGTDGGVAVRIELLPTFIGCPALQAIGEEVRRRVRGLPGVTDVAGPFVFDPPWTVDRIRAEGRASLQQFGVTVPLATTPAETAPAPACPFCGSTAVQLESPFGPTRCRMIYYCTSCKNPFENMKRLDVPE